MLRAARSGVGQGNRRANRAKRPQGRAARSLKSAGSPVSTGARLIDAGRDSGPAQLLRVRRHQVDQPVAGAVGPGHLRVEVVGSHGRGRARRAPRRSPDSDPVRRRDRGTPVPVRPGSRTWPWRRGRRTRRLGPCPASRRAPRPGRATSGSTRAMGTQSATRMANVTAGDRVTRMSASAMASSSCRVPRPGVAGSDRDGGRAVHLAGVDHGPEVDAERRGGPGPVGLDAIGVVAHVQAEVQGVVRRGGDAAGPRRDGHPRSVRSCALPRQQARGLGHGTEAMRLRSHPTSWWARWRAAADPSASPRSGPSPAR